MWNDPEQRNYRIPIKGEAAPVLKKKILEEVISGWRMVRKWDRSFKTQMIVTDLSVSLIRQLILIVLYREIYYAF